MPFTYGLFTSLNFFANQRDQWSVIFGGENESILVLLFSNSWVFHASDLNHPRATKLGVVIQKFQKCFHRQDLILFQCAVLSRSQPPFATI